MLLFPSVERCGLDFDPCLLGLPWPCSGTLPASLRLVLSVILDPAVGLQDVAPASATSSGVDFTSELSLSDSPSLLVTGEGTQRWESSVVFARVRLQGGNEGTAKAGGSFFPRVFKRAGKLKALYRAEQASSTLHQVLQCRFCSLCFIVRSAALEGT